MSGNDIGNALYQRVDAARGMFFLQGELAQLSYSAFDITVTSINASENKDITFSFPVGYSDQKQPMMSDRTYQKEELITKYEFLANHQLATNGIYQLVTLTEAMLGDLLRIIITALPKKLGSKRSIQSRVILSATSIEEVHRYAVDAMINELAYKSPKEFAVEVDNLLGVNLLGCISFQDYIETKATRDIYIHNRGIANELYVNKTQEKARAGIGELLIVDTKYFMESYETCLKITEWLETELHKKWPSSEYAESLAKRTLFLKNNAQADETSTSN